MKTQEKNCGKVKKSLDVESIYCEHKNASISEVRASSEATAEAGQLTDRRIPPEVSKK